ncbi:hypothetical protein DCO45_12015 [Comamonas sp. JNW]|jgi:hypothetical protein|nr:hypothetical protein DCO45_12015 [Comamonas sp. JNW]
MHHAQTSQWGVVTSQGGDVVQRWRRDGQPPGSSFEDLWCGTMVFKGLAQIMWAMNLTRRKP